MSKDDLLGKETVTHNREKLKQEMDIKKDFNNTEKQIKTKINKKKQENFIKNKIVPKLFVSGRLDRKRHTYTAKSLILLATLEDEIKAYCRGGELAILNYLIKEGLKHVKESSTPVNVDMAELENDIT